VNEEVDVSCISMVINKTKAKKAAAQPSCAQFVKHEPRLASHLLVSGNQSLSCM